MQFDLSGKRVIVTGASRGIGREIARLFATERAKLAICARGQDALQAVAAELKNIGAQDVIAQQVDINSTAESRDFVAEIAKAWGGVDVLVNNAGQGFNGSLTMTEPEDLLAHANQSQISHYRFSQAVIPHMRAQRWGRIIDINAMSGVYPSGISSGINRAACGALTKALAQTVARDNILVNGLNMGWIDTGQWDRHFREEMPPSVTRDEFRNMVQGVVPMGRFGKPEEVAGMVLFLTSEFANYISGASIDIAGALGGEMNYLPRLMAEKRAGGK
jgi:3-oxoacyl-[acyl-carrier protein] reductase